MTSTNRISITVPGSSPTAQADRDAQIAHLQSLFSTSPWKFWRYTDTNSGLGTWSYTAACYVYTSGILTVVTVSCSGMAHPPSGSNLTAMPDPGTGTAYPWVAVDAPPIITTPGTEGAGWSAPSLSNNVLTWRIPGNSSTAPADFTAAVSNISANTPISPGYWKYYKYVDSVSGAWEVDALGLYMSSTIVPVAFLVTCSGTPNPPTGSQAPAVALPAFTQTFTTLSAPLSFSPRR